MSSHTLRDQLSRTTDVLSKDPAPVGPTELPQPCGRLSEKVVRGLVSPSGRGLTLTASEPGEVEDPLSDRDFQLALWILYELHHRGFAGVDESLEWNPDVLATRASLESVFEPALRALVDLPDPLPSTAEELVLGLRKMTLATEEPELAAFLAREATEEQFREYLAGRAVYHLREADAQCFLLARLGGAAKVALAEIQYDELGAGRPERLHAELFARALASLDLPTDLASYLETTDAEQLASVNATSMLNLHRRLRGAAAGHFAAFEATSSAPCRLVAAGVQRLGLPDAVADYYLEHVEADAVHEQVAISDVCGALVADEPGLAADVMFGAAVSLAVDGLAADALLDRWLGPPEEAAS